MSTITDIKDRSPNKDLIRMLEILLDDARNGRLRSSVWLCGWDDDSVSHGWVWDKRTSHRRLIAEQVMLQQDMVINRGLMDGDSILAKRFFEVE